jgi:rRNA maturation RNase YbeY
LSGSLLIKNRQRAVPLDTRLLRGMTRALLRELLELETFDLVIYIVRAPEMTALNETFLHHSGSTDVITFDYSDNVLPASCRQTKPNLPAGQQKHVPNVLPASCRQIPPADGPKHVHGEIFICMDDALAQARQFRTSWPGELTRYVIHGILHLRGFDDIRPADRRKMKREENRLLRNLGRLFHLRNLAAAAKLAP